MPPRYGGSNRRFVRRTWLPSVLCLAVAASLFSGVTAGALWDPHELSVAEPARRIALNLLGGSQLVLLALRHDLEHVRDADRVARIE